jgi:hypothetical protein
VNTGGLYDDFLILIFLHTHCETSHLDGEFRRNLFSFVSFALSV